MLPKLRNVKRLWWALLLALGAALSLGAYLRRGDDVSYRTAPIVRGGIEATITATGTCNAVTTVQVGSQVSGNISALYADFNTPVKKGQLVAKIDPQSFQAKVIQAKASLAAARAAVADARAMLAKSGADIAAAKAGVDQAAANTAKAEAAAADAKAKFDRRAALAKSGILSAEDRETAQTAYRSSVAAVNEAKAQQEAAADTLVQTQKQRDVAQAQVTAAEAQVTQAQANLDQAQIDLQRTSILAPVDGTVVSRNVDVGQTVAASLQAPTLFLIAQDLTKMQVDTNVDEADVGQVRVNQPAAFTVDAYPGATFRGAVTQIRRAPITIQNVVTYDVVIDVANPELRLFPGMTANVTIVREKHDNVLKVPNAALRFRPEGEAAGFGAGQPDGQVVWVMAGDKLRAVPVETGIAGASYTEVRGNLRAGDRVVVGANQAAASGAMRPPGGRGLRL